MKMKTCQECGRRRPLKKLYVSGAEVRAKIIQCREVCTEECAELMERVRHPKSDSIKAAAKKLGVPITEVTLSKVNMVDFVGYPVIKDDADSDS